MAGPGFERVLGDRPASLIIKLIFVSLIVGAAMALLGLSPQSIVRGAMRFIRSIWDMGFDALHEIASWVFAGALIVIPVWVVVRVLGNRR